MQELGSAWVFKRAIKDNKVFNSADDILNDKETFNRNSENMENHW